MSTETERSGGETSANPLPAWTGQYLRDHALHAAVVVLFILYPFVYDVLVGEFGLAAETFLLQPRTMLTVLWLGLFAMSFDFVSGYTGYLSFGHAAFFGIGAYTVVLGYNGQLPLVPAELPFMTLLVLGGLIAVVAAVLIGLIAFRLSGVYFAMITLGVSEILFVASENLDFLTPGGGDPSDGVNPGTPTDVETFDPELGVPFVDALQVQLGAFGDTSILGLDIAPLLSEGNPAIVVSYFAIGAVVLTSYLVMQRIIHSPFGRVMIAISENEERARAIGYNTFWYKMGAFAISAFFGAIAGGLLVGYNGFVQPTDTFFFLVTGFALVAAIIGGLKTLAGPLFGYVFLEFVEELLATESNGGGVQAFLRENLPDSLLDATISGGLTVDKAIESFMTGHGEFYAGIIFVLFVLFVPIGLLGTLRLSLGERSVAGHLSGRLDQYGPSLTGIYAGLFAFLLATPLAVRELGSVDSILVGLVLAAVVGVVVTLAVGVVSGRLHAHEGRLVGVYSGLLLGSAVGYLLRREEILVDGLADVLPIGLTLAALPAVVLVAVVAGFLVDRLVGSVASARRETSADAR
jgi:branched-chain amino acid transport system permease protein